MKASDSIFIKLPWASSSRVPVEGEVFDGEVLASAGLTMVDAPSSSSGEPEEEQLLRRLLSLYRARQAKLESREVLVAQAGVEIEKHAEELQSRNQEALRSIAEERAQLAEARKACLLEKAEAEEQQRLAAEELSVREGELTQRKVNLDSYKEELAAREETLGRALKEAKEAVVAAEAAKKELEVKVTQLEADLKMKNEELAALQREREKDALAHGKLQGRLLERGKELSAAKDSNADLELKLATLTKTLDGAKKREEDLKEEIKANEVLLTRAAETQNTFKDTVELWTEGLMNIAAVIDEELAQLEMEGFGYSSDENLQPSAKLTLFFKGVATALQQLRERIPKQLPDESRTICARVLEKVLVKVAFRNPGLNLTNVLKKLPAGADLEELRALVAPIVDKVNEVRRVDGDRVD